MNRFSLLSLYLGAALVVTGCSLYSRPLGFIVAGSFLIYMGVVSAKKAN